MFFIGIVFSEYLLLDYLDNLLGRNNRLLRHSNRLNLITLLILSDCSKNTRSLCCRRCRSIKDIIIINLLLSNRGGSRGRTTRRRRSMAVTFIRKGEATDGVRELVYTKLDALP